MIRHALSLVMHFGVNNIKKNNLSMNLKKYKLTNDCSWYYKYAKERGKQQLDAYINRVYFTLSKMKPGERFEIHKRVAEENLELFIKSACWFMDDYFKGNPNDNFFFSEDYSIIYRRK